MKNITLSAALLSGLLLAGCGAEQAEPEVPAVELETLEQKFSYLLGYTGAQQLEAQGLTIEESAYIDGLKQFIAGEESIFSPEEAQAVFAEFQAKMQAEAQVEFDAIAQENAAKSEAFMAENGAKEGVVTTESGLQYKVLEAGEGDMPTRESIVQVHYEGRLITGEVFDSSIGNAPVEFGLAQVIPGWTEALQLMMQGAKWELYIPSDLAYGNSGNSRIGPNEALIFEVQLLQANFKAEEATE